MLQRRLAALRPKLRLDDVVAGVAEQARKITVGNGIDPATQMGPLISDEQFERVLGYLSRAWTPAPRPSSAAGGAATAATSSSRRC